jgi:hypothetical protein
VSAHVDALPNAIPDEAGLVAPDVAVTGTASSPTGAAGGLAERLRGALGRMLDLRSAMGFARATYHYALTPFIDWCGEEWDAEPLVTAPIVDGWLAHHRYESPNS